MLTHRVYTTHDVDSTAAVIGFITLKPGILDGTNGATFADPNGPSIKRGFVVVKLAVIDGVYCTVSIDAQGTAGFGPATAEFATNKLVHHTTIEDLRVFCVCMWSVTNRVGAVRSTCGVVLV
jgi:hypothetical protein